MRGIPRSPSASRPLTSSTKGAGRSQTCPYRFSCPPLGSCFRRNGGCLWGMPYNPDWKSKVGLQEGW